VTTDEFTPLRALYIVPSLDRRTGGPAYAAAQYVRALCDAGVTTDVATRSDFTAAEEWLHAAEPRAHVYSFAAYGWGNFYLSPGFLGWLARASGAYDIIHVHGVFNGFCSLAATVALGQHRPVVLTPCGMLSRYSFTNRRRRLKRLFHRIVDAPNLRRISAVQFESEGEREEAEELGLVSPERGWVIPPPLAPVTITRRWGPGTARVLFLSRLDPKKNVELLIDAWPVVLQSIPHAQLTIAGHGDPGYSRTLQSRARNLGAPSASISFAGFVSEAQKQLLLGEADLFVLPSRHENFGMAALEAVAAGVPVVVSDDVELAPFIEKNQLGRLTRSTAPSLATAVIGALSADALRTHCETVGPKLVRASFGPRSVGMALRGVYEVVLRSARPPRPRSAEPGKVRQAGVRTF
jgi:glycosyltransferase involved in cell wall biosynthesis